MSPSSRTPPSSPPPPSLFLLLKSYPFLSSPRLDLMIYLLVPFRSIIAVPVPLFLSLLLRPLLTHFLSLQLLLPRLCLLLMTCPLLFGKVIALLEILILFTIFLVTIDYLPPTLHLFLLFPQFLFLRTPMRHFPIRAGDRQW